MKLSPNLDKSTHAFIYEILAILIIGGGVSLTINRVVGGLTAITVAFFIERIRGIYENTW
jgi:hypothetical protein